MTRLPDPLTDRRHLATAAVVGLIVQAASLGAVGFAAAGDGGDDLPETLEVPPARVGDRGVYTWTVVDRDEPSRVVEEERKLVEFEMLEDRVVRDAEGEAHLSHRIRQAFLYPGNYRPDADFYDWVLTVPVHDDAPVAYTYTSDETTRDDGETTVEQARQRNYVREGVNRTERLCGLLNRLQNRTVDLDGDLSLFRGCSLAWLEVEAAGSIGGLGELTFEPNRSEEVAGRNAIVFEANGTQERTDYFRSRYRPVEVWMPPTLAYPLKMVVPADDGNLGVIRLTRFEAGGESIAAADEDIPEDPLGDVETAPRKRWGPDASGVDHPFPLRTAFEHARDNPSNSTLRDFLGDHPDAYVHRAQYSIGTVRASEQDAWTQRLWLFRVTDGQAVLQVNVIRRAAGFGGQDLPAGPGPAPFAEEIDYRFLEDGEDYYSSTLLPPDRVPDDLPTVASLMERWRPYATESYREMPPNAWGLSIGCGSDCTDDLDIRVSAGVTRARGNASQYDQRASRLTVDETGRARSLYEFRRDIYRDDPPPQLGEGGNGSIAASGLDVPLWSVPTAEQAAAVGLVAALTALLYWLWPAIKGVGLAGLRTRLTSEEALDHPVRRELMDRIEAEPGVHRNELIESLEAGNGTVRHHLDKLVDLDHVVETRGQGYACYFPEGRIDRRVMAAAPALRSNSARRILEAILDEPGLSNGEVAARTGLSPSTVSHHLARLQEADLVRADTDGRSLSLVPTELAGRAVDALAG